MTRMLASITGPEEARIALAGGADIIDLQDPERGALGMVAPDLIRATAALLRARVPLSAASGDMSMQPEPVLRAVRAAIDAGATIVKIGIPAGDAAESCVRALAALAEKAQLIAVLFADGDPGLVRIPRIAQAGFAGVMLDTANKGNGRLLDHMDLPRLRAFAAECRAHGLLAGLAGALEAPDIPRLLVLDPAVLGFRSALCPSGRSGPIAPESVCAIRALIPHEIGVERVPAGLDPGPGVSRTDRVFLRDWVLPVRIGVYAREHSAPQRVRFTVEAWVTRGRATTRDLGDVFSYDLISDGIRMLTEGRHVDLAETLAERIAALVLAHPRVVKVAVSVEKLDVGTGVVGVAIERQRDDPVPPVELLSAGDGP